MAGRYEQAKELRKMWGAFQASRVLLTANNFRIFDRLEKEKSTKKISGEIGADIRATEIVLDALAGLGLVRKRNGKYRNMSVASKFLVSHSPWYQGDIIRHADVLWENWSGLDRVLRTGKPNRKASDHKSFIMGMHNISVLKARKIIKEIVLDDVTSALDLGGGPGTYSIELARKGIGVTLFDVPETKNIAGKVIRESGADGRKINFKAGDFMEDDIGKGYDLILVSQIFHAYAEYKNKILLKKCRRALNPGGRVVVQEFPVSEDRTKPVLGSLFAINMLVNTEGGRTYTPAELKQWMTGTGFNNIRKKIVDDSVLLIGRN
jgi:2-polyprenyl-3-methyl-5-hydroxy-6-metoxy-1,4-benzoquinol methylase